MRRVCFSFFSGPVGIGSVSCARRSRPYAGYGVSASDKAHRRDFRYATQSVCFSDRLSLVGGGGLKLLLCHVVKDVRL